MSPDLRRTPTEEDRMRRNTHWIRCGALGAVLALGGWGCMGDTGGDSNDTTTVTSELSLGDALPGTNATTFAAARANFIATESAVDGLGPIFNEHACGNCHQNGAVGGAGQQIEQRYGTITNGTFNTLG